ncbi:hypothetical protein JCM6882_005625 [Rhodosporidiobolus microsporus]
MATEITAKPTMDRDTETAPSTAAPSSRPSSPSIRSFSTDTASTHAYPPSTVASERELPALAPADRGKAAYLFLLGAFAVETVVWGLPSSYGLFLEHYQREGLSSDGQYKDSGLLPLVGTVAAGFIYLLGPPVSLLLNPRPRWRLNVIRLGAVLCVLSLLLSSFAKTPWQLLLTQGLLYSVGGAMAYYSTFYFLSEWFIERRGFANGVCFAGTAAGGLVLPFILEVLLRKWGAARTLQGLAVSTCVLLGAALPLIKPRLPLPAKGVSAAAQKKETAEDDTASRTEGEASSVLGVEGGEPDKVQREDRPTAKKLFKNGGLWVFMIANVAQAFAYFASTLYLPTFGSSIGLSTTSSSALLACVNGAAVLSRVALGILSDKHSPHSLGFGTMLFSSVAVFIVWGVASTSLAPLLVFSLVLGLGAGGWTSLYSAIIKSCVENDPSLSSHLFSLISLTRGLGSLLSAPVSSALLAHPFPSSSSNTAFGVDKGRWGPLVVFVGGCLMVAAGCEAGLRWVGRGWGKKTVARE